MFKNVRTLLCTFIFAGSALLTSAQKPATQSGVDPSANQRLVVTPSLQNKVSLAATPTCPLDVVTNNDPGVCGATVGYSIPTLTVPRVSQTQREMTPGSSFRCFWVQTNNPNTFASYYRLYNLPASNISQASTITSVEFGVRVATSAGGTQPVTVNVYSYDPATPFKPVNFTLQATSPVTIADGFNYFVDVPLNATIPAGKAMVLELAVPDDLNGSNVLFVGANNLPETSTSYVLNACTAPSNPDPIPTTSWAPAGLAHFILDAHGTFVVDGVLTSGLASGSVFPIGTTTNTVTYDLQDGTSTSCNFTVTVNDTENPDLSGLSASPNVLWPPNHQMVNIALSYASGDNCPGTTCAVTSITSNEPINGLGDGDTSPDWAFVDNHSVQLRAERSGKGKGRTYTITVTCTDAGGNATSKNVTVFVPKSQGGNNSRVVTPFVAPAELTASTLTVYPNPTTGEFSVQSQDAPLQLEVLNANGTIVFQQRVAAYSKGQRLAVNLSKQPAGTYLVKVTTEKGVETTRVLLKK